MRRRDDVRRDERGIVSITMAVALIALFGVAALAVDLGHHFVVEGDLQTAADSAALAALQDLDDPDAAVAAAIAYAEANHDEGTVLDPDDIVFGFWDAETATFVPDGAGDPDNPVTAVQVTTRRTEGSGNPVSNVFAPVLGIDTTNIVATGMAALAFTTVDFEGLAPGALPLGLSSGAGVSGEPVDGTIGIQSTSDHQNSRDCPIVGGVRTCQRIFDGRCIGGCTGGDPDLRFPEQGNLLIIQEHRCNGDWPDDVDYDGTNWPDNCQNKSPDDEARGGSLYFDFTEFGDGSVTVASMKLLDVEPFEIVHVTLWDADGNVLSEQQSGGPGDGNAMTWWLEPVSGVAYMEIELAGSGAIDDLGYLRDTKLVG